MLGLPNERSEVGGLVSVSLILIFKWSVNQFWLVVFNKKIWFLKIMIDWCFIKLSTTDYNTTWDFLSKFFSTFQYHNCEENCLKKDIILWFESVPQNMIGVFKKLPQQQTTMYNHYIDFHRIWITPSARNNKIWIYFVHTNPQR